MDKETDQDHSHVIAQEVRDQRSLLWQRLAEDGEQELLSVIAQLTGYEVARFTDQQIDFQSFARAIILLHKNPDRFAKIKESYLAFHDRETALELVAVVIAALIRCRDELTEHEDIPVREEILDTVLSLRESVLEKRANWDQYITVAQMAANFKISPQAVYKWIRLGKVEAVKTPGGSYRLRPDSIRTSAEDEQRLDDLAEAMRKQTRGTLPPTAEQLMEWLEAMEASRKETINDEEPKEE